MKFPIHKSSREQGGALVITLFVTTSILIVLASYLLLVRAQYVSVARSQAWGGSLTIAEAGVEEALAQLNPGAVDKTISVDRSANGWGLPSGGFYGPVSRNVTTNNSFSVVFTTDVSPVIYSTGYVRLPDVSATLTRVLRVGTSNVPLYTVSMAARTNIDMNGNGLSADSFDSSNTNLSTNGRYDSSKTTTNGDVAVLYGSLDLGGHTVAGDVYLGPNATLNGGAGQVSGQIYHDFNSDFPDVTLPPNAAIWPAPLPSAGIINGTAYTYIFNTSGDYAIALATGSIYVNTNAHVRLLIQAGGIGSIAVAGSGNKAGQLTMYVAASSFSLGGGGTVDGGRAANLTYLGLPSNKSISLSGDAAFTGTIYAPEASLTLNGGGSNNYDFVGSCIAASVNFNGHFMFHFDQDLLNSGASRGFLAVSWTEL